MKNLLKIRMFVAVLAFLTAMGGVMEISAQRRTTTRNRPALKRTVVKRTTVPSTRYFTVQSGQVLRARLNTTLSSKTARVGNTFTATVTEPVYADNGTMVIPTGSVLTGRIDSVQAAQKGGKPGTIDAHFVSLRTPNGTNRSINGTLTDLTTDDAKSDSEGTARGDKMKNRKLIFIGGGGAGGAVLGAAVGGGKGALIGGILGAGAGFLGDRLTKGEEAEVRSGTEFGVYLNQSVSLPKFQEVNP
jgi:hypothetical protein